MISLLCPSKLVSLLSLNSNTLISTLTLPLLGIVILSVPSVQSPLSLCPALCPVFLCLMPLSQTLLLLRSACWNTRWRKGAGVGVGVIVRQGVGVLVEEVGAILTSSQQQWWWSSARCSLAPRVLYGPPSPPQSSLGPGKKKGRFYTFNLVWSSWMKVMGMCCPGQGVLAETVSNTTLYITFWQLPPQLTDAVVVI